MLQNNWKKLQHYKQEVRRQKEKGEGDASNTFSFLEPKLLAHLAQVCQMYSIRVLGM